MHQKLEIPLIIAFYILTAPASLVGQEARQLFHHCLVGEKHSRDILPTLLSLHSLSLSRYLENETPGRNVSRYCGFLCLGFAKLVSLIVCLVQTYVVMPPSAPPIPTQARVLSPKKRPLRPFPRHSLSPLRPSCSWEGCSERRPNGAELAC